LQGPGAGQGPPGQPLCRTATRPGGILVTSRDVQDTPFACHRGRPGAAWPALVGPGRSPPELAGFDDAEAQRNAGGRLFLPPLILSSSLSLVPSSPLAFLLRTAAHTPGMHELFQEPQLRNALAAPSPFAPVHCDPPCRPHPRPPASPAQATNSLIGPISTRSTACSRVSGAWAHRRPTL
jgi:hypothetical protein